MEFYIKYTDTDMVRLPVPPPSFKIQRQNATQTVTVSQLGEVNLWGPALLETVTISSFWPYRYMPTYCKYKNFIKPKDFVNWVKKCKDSKNPVRLVITDSKTGLDVNMSCLIEQFDTEVKNFNGDIDFTISFREYRKVGVKEQETPKPPSSNNTSSNNSNSSSNNSSNSSNSSTGYTYYTVKKGDTLWSIAKKHYGSGSKWPTIYNANKDKIKNANVISPGWVIKIPKSA